MKRFLRQLKTVQEKDILLSTDEKKHIRSQLARYMETRPVRNTAPHRPVWQSWKDSFTASFTSMNHLSTKAAVFATVAIILISGTGVVQAAEKSLPGDTLYGVKLAITEPVRGFLAITSEQKAAWETARVERRLVEASALLASTHTDTGTLEDHLRRITEQNNRATDAIETVSRDDHRTALFLQARFEALLRAYSASHDGNRGRGQNRDEFTEELLALISSEADTQTAAGQTLAETSTSTSTAKTNAEIAIALADATIREIKEHRGDDVNHVSSFPTLHAAETLLTEARALFIRGEYQAASVLAHNATTLALRFDIEHDNRGSRSTNRDQETREDETPDTATPTPDTRVDDTNSPENQSHDREREPERETPRNNQNQNAETPPAPANSGTNTGSNQTNNSGSSNTNTPSSSRAPGLGPSRGQIDNTAPTNQLRQSADEAIERADAIYRTAERVVRTNAITRAAGQTILTSAKNSLDTARQEYRRGSYLEAINTAAVAIELSVTAETTATAAFHNLAPVENTSSTPETLNPESILPVVNIPTNVPHFEEPDPEETENPVTWIPVTTTVQVIEIPGNLPNLPGLSPGATSPESPVATTTVITTIERPTLEPAPLRLP